MSKKKSINIVTFILTFVIVNIVCQLTGFHYSFSDGILNIKLLIDLGLWLIIYIPINIIVDKISLAKAR